MVKKKKAPFLKRLFPGSPVLRIIFVVVTLITAIVVVQNAYHYIRIRQQEAQLFFDEGYRFGEEGEGFERMNLACPKAVLLKALERLETVLRRYE